MTDKEQDSKVWLYKEIAKTLNITESKASEIVHICFEEFKANVDSYNEALSIRNSDLQEELETIKERLESAIKLLRVG